MNRINILVVDDEVAETIKENLEDVKLNDAVFSIQSFMKSQDAIDDINAQKEKKKFYDVVILDMKMDGIEERGIDILDLNLPSLNIVLTARAAVENCVKCLRLGAYDYIDKNSTKYDPMERLIESIKKGLSCRQQEQISPFEKWWKENRSALADEFKEKYLAIISDTVVDSANNRNTLIKRVKKKYPFFKAEIVKLN